MTAGAHHILRQARAAGISLAADGGRLKLRAKQRPAPELLEALRRHKFELLALLNTPQPCSGAVAPLLLDEAAARITVWLTAIDNLPEMSTQEGKRLAQLVEAFWLGPWARPALDAGWSDGDLFALDCGLIPEMSRQTLYFLHIDAEAARLMTGRGVVEHFHRPRTSAPPWWNDPRMHA